MFLSPTDQLLAAQGHRAPQLARHSLQVAALAVEIGRAAGVDTAMLADLHLTGLLHDCGLATLPPALLQQKRTLRWMERAQLQTHAIRGAEWLRSAPELDAIRWAIQHHHERWDGHGYPQRLAGDEIPLPARIVGLAEAVISMITPTPYRRALTPVEVFSEVLQEAGRQFDPTLVIVIAPALMAWMVDPSTDAPVAAALTAAAQVAA